VSIGFQYNNKINIMCDIYATLQVNT